MKVHTETGSVYQIDGDQVIRQPSKDGEQLRRDEESVRLVQMLQAPVKGQPMIMIIQIRDDDVVTLRRTSNVVKVEK